MTGATTTRAASALQFPLANVRPAAGRRRAGLGEQPDQDGLRALVQHDQVIRQRPADRRSAVGRSPATSYQISVPTSYAAVIEAMGSEQGRRGLVRAVRLCAGQPEVQRPGDPEHRAQQRHDLYLGVHHRRPVGEDACRTSRARSSPLWTRRRPPATSTRCAYLKAWASIPKTFFSETRFRRRPRQGRQAVYNGNVSGGAVFGGPPNPVHRRCRPTPAP